MTERAQNADFRRKPQIFADSPLLLGIHAFGRRRKPQKTADFRRKPKIVGRKPQETAPQESFEAIFCLENCFYFLRLFLKTLRKYALNKHKNNLARLFLFFEVIFCLARLFLKNSLKRFLGQIGLRHLRCVTFSSALDPESFPLGSMDSFERQDLVIDTPRSALSAESRICGEEPASESRQVCITWKSSEKVFVSQVFDSTFFTFWKHPKGTRPKGTGRELTFRENSSEILMKF